MLKVAARADEEEESSQWKRGLEGEEDSFRETSGFLSLEAASGSPHTGPAEPVQVGVPLPPGHS